MLNDHRVSSTMVEEMNWCPSTYLLFYVTHGVEKHEQKSFLAPGVKVSDSPDGRLLGGVILLENKMHSI